MDSIYISDEIININESSLTSIKNMVLLEDQHVLGIQFFQKQLKSTMQSEIWNLKKKSIVASGKFDVFGMKFLTEFKKYIDNTVAVLVSRNGEREILIYDFFNQEKVSFCKNLAYEEYQINSNDFTNEIYTIPNKEMIILVEKNFMENTVSYKDDDNDDEEENKNNNQSSGDDSEDKEIPGKHYMIMKIIVLKKNNVIAQISLRRDYSKKREQMKILKGNDQCLIIADQYNGEVMLWDFVKYPKEPFYLSLDCSDYIFKYVYFDRIEDNQLIKFLFQNKIDKMIKVLIYNFTTKNALVQSLKPSAKELQYVSNIKYGNFFYLQNCGILLTCNKYNQDDESIYFNVYKRNYQSDVSEQEYELISDFQHGCDSFPLFLEFNEYDHIVFQNTPIQNTMECKDKMFEFRLFDFKESVQQQQQKKNKK